MEKLTMWLEPYDKDDQNVYSPMGGDMSNPSWEEYISKLYDEFKPHYELLKSWALSKRRPIYGFDIEGYTICFSDGDKISMTHRAWGDFMQAALDKREGYCEYAWDAPKDSEPLNLEEDVKMSELKDGSNSN